MTSSSSRTAAQSAVGHHGGSGAIKPGEPIVIDIWPAARQRVRLLRRHTWTFVVGEPPGRARPSGTGSSSRRSSGRRRIRGPGASGRAVYDNDLRALRGPRASSTAARTKQPGEPLEEGFFHWGLGHGVGLEVHEAPVDGTPRDGPRSSPGDVVTVEPGLYRPGFGALPRTSCSSPRAAPHNLTSFPYHLPAVTERTSTRSTRCSSRSGGIRRRPSSRRRRTRSRTSTTSDFEAFWEPPGPRAGCVVRAVHGALRMGAAVREVVSRRQAQRLLQLRRPPRRGRPRRQGRVPLGRRAGRRDARRSRMREPQRDVVRFANALKKLGVHEGHARRDLHGHGSGAAGRDARVHAARRAAHRRLRRLLGRLALGPAWSTWAARC